MFWFAIVYYCTLQLLQCRQPEQLLPRPFLLTARLHFRWVQAHFGCVQFLFGLSRGIPGSLCPQQVGSQYTEQLLLLQDMRVIITVKAKSNISGDFFSFKENLEKNCFFFICFQLFFLSFCLITLSCPTQNTSENIC